MFLKQLDVQGYRASSSSPLSCSFTGRFNLLVGANGAGKTTINEAIVHAHRHRFPRFGPVDAAALGPAPRAVSVEYGYEDDPSSEGSLGLALRRAGFGPPRWSRPLERSLGRVRTGTVVDATEGFDNVRLIYLPAMRNPVDELSRRDAQVLLELLRAEQSRHPGTQGLAALRARAQAMLASLTAEQLVVDVQGRIADNLSSITSGVQSHYAYIGTQQVDDAYLARVFEILLATLPNPALARRLEASSLGYVNLLHIAVTLAGIPDPANVPPLGPAAPNPSPPQPAAAPPETVEPAEIDDLEATAARARLQDASQAAEADQDSFFPDLFHATVLIEEPEAHLHPQLQYGLVRYLRRVALDRPDIQVIVTTHSGELAAACDPSELVIVRRNARGESVARTLAAIPLLPAKKADLFQQTRLHMDANRSGSLFADRVLVVEGVTEAALMRVIGRVWAAGDPRKEAFIDSLAILPVGHKIGEWPVRILATPGFELVTKVAALSDTDLRGGEPLPLPPLPPWHAELDPNSARFFWSRPTLEPSIVAGNEHIVEVALANLDVDIPTPITPAAVDAIFSGTAKRKKSRFALELAAAIEDDLIGVNVPSHIADLLNWLYPADDDVLAPDANETPA